jgi:hypothetical protein
MDGKAFWITHGEWDAIGVWTGPRYAGLKNGLDGVQVLRGRDRALR